MDFSKANVKSRLKRGIAASSFGFSVNLLTQLTTVPLLLYFWGADVYGEWLILTAIPAYISFSNMGISDAMATEMTILSGKQEYEQAQSIFENAWKVVTLVSALVAAIVVTAAYVVLPVEGVFGISVITNSEVAIIVSLFSVYILLGIQISLISGVYRCVGHYPAYTFIVTLSRFVELLIGMAAVSLGQGPVALVVVYVITRVFFIAFLTISISQYNAWIKLSFSAINLKPIKGIIKPSLSSAGYGVGNMVVNQSVILSVGHFLGANAVASYSVMRTLTRVLLKFAGILNSNYMPELSAAYGAKDIELFRHLNRELSKYTFWMIVAAVVSLGVFGKSILSLWTLGKVEIDALIFFFVVLEAAIYFVGYTGSVPIVAINRHATFVIVYVAFALLSLCLSWATVPLFGLVAVPLLFSLGNLMVGCFVVMTVMKISEDRIFGYVSNVILLKNSD